MRTMGAFQAKTHFSELLVFVEQGEFITITKHGKPVARLTPVEAKKSRQNVIQEAVRRLRRNRKGVTLAKNQSIRAMIEMGRK